jgi:predicted permease
VLIRGNYPGFGATDLQLAVVEVNDIRATTRVFSHIAGMTAADFTLTGRGAVEGVTGRRVSASLFPMLDVQPILGRFFGGEAEEYGQHHVVVISEGLWKRRFGADPDIVGTSIEINREPHRVVAVSPPVPTLRGSGELWVPFSFPPAQTAPETRGAKGVDVIARLAAGVTLESAARDLALATASLSAQYPGHYRIDPGFSLSATSFVSAVAGNLRQPLLFLLAAVGVLMLIGCANVSNLLMARAAARRKEMSVRAALGASRARVAGQLMTESAVIAGVAGAVGVAIAAVLLRLFELYGPRNLVPATGLGWNGWVVAFAVGASFVASVLFGLIPALTSSAGMGHTLKESSRGVTAGRARVREAMVALQVTASLVLLVSAGLLIRSFLRVQDADPGFDAANVLTFDLQLPISHYPEPTQRVALYEALRSRLDALPGVVAVGAVDRIPFGGREGGANLRIVGRPVDPKVAQPLLRSARVLPGYFESLGVPLSRGRYFTTGDTPDTVPVVIIDEATARRFFPGGEDPIGRQVYDVEPGVTATIVGVVGSVKRRDLSTDPEMSVYHAASQRVGARLTFTVKTATEPIAMLPAIRRELAALDPLLPLTGIVTMDERLAESMARRRLSMQLISFFGATALLLAATSLYGVLSYVVTQRRRELVIRTALGAQPRQVIELVAKQGVMPVALGVVAGLVAAVWVTQLLTGTLYSISPLDPVVYLAVTGLLALTAMLAIAVPARRAATVDPVVALRDE